MKRKTHSQLGVEALETRNLMSFGLSGSIYTGAIQLPASQPQVQNTATKLPAFSSEVGTSPGVAASLESLAPRLSSNPGASHTLYLNFDGDYRNAWSNFEGYEPHTYHNVQTYPFERIDYSLLTDAQRAQITEIWARVAEDYAPFDVNVITVDPGNLDNGKTLMVNIGTSNGWFKDQYGLARSDTGTSSIGSFTDSYPNVVFVFLDNVATGYGAYNDPTLAAKVADTASHESGHGFGLLHHHVLNDDGTLQKEYDPGSGNWTPIMGDPLQDTRHTWGIGTTGQVGTDPGGNPYDNRGVEVDSNVLGAVLGFRADDFGDDLAHATRLDLVNGAATVNGIVGLRKQQLITIWGSPLVVPGNQDADVFSFDNAYDGQVTIRADVLGYHNGSDLNARIELWSKDGPITAVNPSDNQGNAQLTYNLAAGTYYVMVTGVGAFDAGQYTLTVRTPSFTVRSTQESGISRVGQLINGFAADTDGLSPAESGTAEADATMVADPSVVADADPATPPVDDAVAPTDTAPLIDPDAVATLDAPPQMVDQPPADDPALLVATDVQTADVPPAAEVQGVNVPTADLQADAQPPDVQPADPLTTDVQLVDVPQTDALPTDVQLVQAPPTDDGTTDVQTSEVSAADQQVDVPPTDLAVGALPVADTALAPAAVDATLTNALQTDYALPLPTPTAVDALLVSEVPMDNAMLMPATDAQLLAV